MFQITNHIALFKPTYFRYYKVGTEDNLFTKDFGSGSGSGSGSGWSLDQVNQQFDMFMRELKAHHVTYTLFDTYPGTPDAVYPDWITFHWEVGGAKLPPTIVIYPMKAQHRRKEREILPDILNRLGLTSDHIIDLTYYEDQNMFLEGKGALVYDRVNKIAYTCLSERAHLEVLERWAELLGYQVCMFRATDQKGRPIYHTDVMMTIGDHFAIVCINAISEQDRQRVISCLEHTSHKKILSIDVSQIESFCGNCLQVENQFHQTVLCLSKRAYQALDSIQLKFLQSFCLGGFVVPEYSMIEDVGGGSIRCSILELGR